LFKSYQISWKRKVLDIKVQKWSIESSQNVHFSWQNTPKRSLAMDLFFAQFKDRASTPSSVTMVLSIFVLVVFAIVICLMLSFIAHIAKNIVRNSTRYCWLCRRSKTEKFCKECGIKTIVQEACLCGKQYPPNGIRKFCSKCGKKLPERY
jgi:hypothetical protein